MLIVCVRLLGWAALFAQALLASLILIILYASFNFSNCHVSSGFLWSMDLLPWSRSLYTVTNFDFKLYEKVQSYYALKLIFIILLKLTSTKMETYFLSES